MYYFAVKTIILGHQERIWKSLSIFTQRRAYTILTWHETKYCQRKEDDFYYGYVVRAHCLRGFQQTVRQLVVQSYVM